MSDRKPSIKKNMIMNAMLEISKILFPIITYPYVARILHKSGTGKVDFALSVVTYFGMFAQLGIPNYGIKAVAKVRDDRQKLSKLVHELLFINLFMAVISYIAFGASLMIVPRFSRESVLLLVMSAIIFLNAIGIEWLYKGMEMYSYITKRSILFKFIGLIAMFLMVKSEDDYIIYGGITIFATAASDVLNFVNSRKYVDYKRQKDYNIRQHMKPVLVFFSMSVAATVYTNLDKVMLGFMKDDAAVGLYGASVKIKNILLGLVTSAGTVLLPRASRYVDQGKLDEFYAVLKKTMHLILLAAIPFCLYFMMYANEGISFLAGEEYAGSIFPMMIIMPTLVLIGITNISGIQMMVPLGMEKHVLISEIIGAVIDLVLNAILIPKFSVEGAALGTLAAEIGVTIYQMYVIKDKPVKLFEEVRFGLIIIASLLGLLAGFWTKYITFMSKLEADCFCKLAISASIFFAVYAAIILLAKDSMAQYLLGLVMSKVKRKGKN
jgi:O-antigen/teichoic acid export membrane protein